MSPDKEKKILEGFPLLYGDKDKSMKETCMCWGIDCEDGWFDIIYDLSEKLERLIEKEEDRPDFGRPKAAQVKSKFATLRFYMTWETNEMSKLIEEAEAKSAEACELCGKPGIIKLDGGWFVTVCEEHGKDLRGRDEEP